MRIGAGGAVDAYLMANFTEPNPDAKRVFMLYSHGSGWNVAVKYRIDRYKFLLSQGNIALLTYDYPGYGASSGSYDEDSIIASGVSALQYLMAEHHVGYSNITLLGRSLGGAVASGLVEHIAEQGGMPRGMIAQSTWGGSFADVIATYFPITQFVARGIYSDWWLSGERIKPLASCLYQSHSHDDEVVAFDVAEELSAEAVNVPATSGCKTFVAVNGLMHDDPMDSKEKVQLSAWLHQQRSA